MMRLLAVFVMTAAAGCSRTEPTTETANVQHATAPARTAVSQNPVAAPQLQLAADGLVMVREGQPPTRIAFGGPRADIVTAVTEVRGRPSGTQSNAECPPGPMDFTSFGDLTLSFQNGSFAGWSLDGAGNPPIRDARGIGVGAARSELERGGASFAESTLGFQFAFGEMYGLMSSDAPDARVTNIWAGTVCQFT